MRVTDAMLSNQMLYNLNLNNDNLQKWQEQLATGHKINQASDDPIGTAYTMKYQELLKQNSDYQNNAGEAVSTMKFLDSTLGQASDVVQRARTLAVAAANDTMSPESRASIKTEIDQLYNQMVQIGNSDYNGKYMFNGQAINVKPYPVTGAETAAGLNSGAITWAVDRGQSVQINVTGVQAFGTPGGQNVFQTLKDLSNALSTGNDAGIQQAIGNLDNDMTRLNGARADAGARMNQIELIQTRLKDAETSMRQGQSQIQDADIASVITNLKMSENVLNSSLATGARIMQTTLVNYLK